MRASKHLGKISSGPPAHKNGQIFSHIRPVLAILEVFLTELEKINKMKKFHMTSEGVFFFIFLHLFVSLIFWPKKCIFECFLHISAILTVFLTEKEKCE